MANNTCKDCRLHKVIDGKQILQARCLDCKRLKRNDHFEEKEGDK